MTRSSSLGAVKDEQQDQAGNKVQDNAMLKQEEKPDLDGLDFLNLDLLKVAASKQGSRAEGKVAGEQRR